MWRINWSLSLLSSEGKERRGWPEFSIPNRFASLFGVHSRTGISQLSPALFTGVKSCWITESFQVRSQDVFDFSSFLRWIIPSGMCLMPNLSSLSPERKRGTTITFLSPCFWPSHSKSLFDRLGKVNSEQWLLQQQPVRVFLSLSLERNLSSWHLWQVLKGFQGEMMERQISLARNGFTKKM